MALFPKVQQQPKSLFLLFFVEMWERFGFYTVQIVLILYMTKSLKLPDQQANLLYAAYSSLVYLTPVLGGFLADRYMGFQKAIIWGAVCYIIGYILASVDAGKYLFWALGFLIAGNGFFKPNVSSLVGELYHQEDPRRDSGFTIFYLGINLGSMFPSLIMGYIIAHYSWNATFCLGAFGIAISLCSFLWKRSMLKKAGSIPAHPKQKNSLYFYMLLAVGIVVSVAICRGLFLIPRWTNASIILAFLIYLIMVFRLVMKKKLVERKKMIGVLLLVLFSIGFWSTYNQTFSVLMLFSDRVLDKQLFSMPFNTQFVQFFNPFFIVTLSPILSYFWLARDKKQSSNIPMKFAYGILFMAVGFILLAWGTRISLHQVSAWWIVASYFIQTLGELCLSPIGLAMITKLCPKEMTGMMMGIWFMMQTASFALAGELALYATIPANATFIEAKQIYSSAFFTYGWIALGCAAVAFVAVPYIKKLIQPRSM